MIAGPRQDTYNTLKGYDKINMSMSPSPLTLLPTCRPTLPKPDDHTSSFLVLSQIIATPLSNQGRASDTTQEDKT